MDFQLDIWDIFHDGSIVEVRGELPDIALRIEIQYLIEKLPGDGDSIWIHLKNCTRIRFTVWESEGEIQLGDINVDDDFEILNSKIDDDSIHIFSPNGQLELTYESSTLELDSGQAISWQTLSQVSQDYWTSFSSHPQN